LIAASLVAITHFDATAQERNSPPPAADTSGLDFHQFGLLAVQDGGRRKPIDTFSRETLIRITGRSTYVGKAGRKWQANDFVLSGALETHDWRTEPMVLVSLGQLKESSASIRRSAVFRLNNWLPQRNCSGSQTKPTP